LVVNGQSQVTELDGGQQILEQELPALPYSSTVLSPDAPAVADELKEKLGAGGFLVNYLGHGSTRTWEGLLQSSDVARLSENASPPIVLAMTCLNGFFQDVYGESLAETFLRRPKGGAVAVWASSALGHAEDQTAANVEVMTALAEPGLSLGEAVKRAKEVTPGGVRKPWILFGDPTLLGKPPASSGITSSRATPSFTGAAPCGCSSGDSAPSLALALLVAWVVRRVALKRA
jgi:uncharacterized protein (TIGR03382 family)